MNILMMTNTFTPHVGGVARSVESFVAGYRRAGHRVLVAAPEFENQPASEQDVVRVPAIQNFNGSDFSVVLSIPSKAFELLEAFGPDVIHSHHPFLLGSAALRLARRNEVPLVFTHHTMYELYTHYVPGKSEAMQRFVIALSTSYANLASHVIAPSESVAGVLESRGVEVPISVIPTGVDTDVFGRGSGHGFRLATNIPTDVPLVGHLGRLAPEKNLELLADGVLRCLRRHADAHFLLVGDGPCLENIRRRFEQAGLAERLHHIPVLRQPLLTSAYKAMDVFVFTSRSETQGMVVTEAMAAGVPVVALDAPGVREVVNDDNGRLLEEASADALALGLEQLLALDEPDKERLRQRCLECAEAHSIGRSVSACLDLYARLVGTEREPEETGSFEALDEAFRSLTAEWALLRGVTNAALQAFSDTAMLPDDGKAG